MCYFLGQEPRPRPRLALNDRATERATHLHQLLALVGQRLLMSTDGTPSIYSQICTPPVCAKLNPIELMWSYFKKEWRRVLMNPTIDIPEGETRGRIKECLDKIAHLARNVSIGPLKALTGYMQNTLPQRRITR